MIQWLKILVLFGVYFLAAKFGLQMDAVSGFATLVWPPTGIALAATLLFGYGVWPGIFLGALLANFSSGAPLAVAGGIAVGNTLEALVGACLLERLNFHKSLDRLKDVAVFIILACGLSTVVSATIGVTCLWLGGVESLEGFGITWRAWWVGDALGSLIVAPLLLTLGTMKIKSQFNFLRVGEFVLLTVLLIFAGYMVFGKPTSLPFWLFPFVVWAGLRFGQAGNAVVVFLLTVMAVWGTSRGFGPFVQGKFRDNLILLNCFMVVISTTGMALAASMAERNLAVRIRDDFLSIASHELKTPLTSLYLQLQVLDGMVNSAKTNSELDLKKIMSKLNMSTKQAKQLGGLINNLLDVSRIESGKLDLETEVFDLMVVLKEAVSRFEEEAAQKGATLHFHGEGKIVGRWDKTRVIQILNNLLSNALKYGEGTPINVSLRTQDGSAVLKVQDQGIGINENDKLRIFNRFERASSDQNISGLGLGLYITRQLAEAHGGRIYVQSEFQKGSTFTVELPLNS